MGIGALNLDYVVTRSHLSKLPTHLRQEYDEKLHHGIEMGTSRTRINEFLGRLGKDAFDTHLGGSSFNVVQVMSNLLPDRGIGFVGVSGKVEERMIGFKERMSELQIDARHVQSVQRESAGACLSYMQHGERSLLTCPGANKQLAHHIENNFEDLVHYLASCRLVHVTSLLDRPSTSMVARLVLQAKAENPRLAISVDPGHTWLTEITRAPLLQLLEVADYLFLNDREFEILGQRDAPGEHLSAADRIVRRSDNDRLVVVHKSRDVVRTYRAQEGTILCETQANRVLPEHVIEDATGAGDVFAAGFLVGTILPGWNHAAGIDLGLRLVRSKLRSVGAASYAVSPKILSEVVSAHGPFGPPLESPQLP